MASAWLVLVLGVAFVAPLNGLAFRAASRHAAMKAARSVGARSRPLTAKEATYDGTRHAEQTKESSASGGEAASMSRPLGRMERLLNARRSSTGAMTTSHVCVSWIDGPPLTHPELLCAMEACVARHPLLNACVRGDDKFDIDHAQPFDLHEDYLGRAIAYKPQLFRPEPEMDPLRFEISPRSPSEMAHLGVSAVDVAVAAETPVGTPASSPVSSFPRSAPALDSRGSEAESEDDTARWVKGLQAEVVSAFQSALDEAYFDPKSDGPLWRLTLFRHPARSEGAAGPETCALLWVANHAISDQLSHQIVISEVLASVASQRAAADETEPQRSIAETEISGLSSGAVSSSVPARLPLPPSVEQALVGMRECYEEPTDARLRALVRCMRPATIRYAAWQIAAGGAAALPDWTPPPQEIGDEYHVKNRRTGAVFRCLDAAQTTALRTVCRARGVTVSGLLCAAALLSASDAMGGNKQGGKGAAAEEPSTYKLLQALNMRPFGKDTPKGGGGSDWSKGSVVAGTGSLDLIVRLRPRSGAAVRRVAKAALGAADDDDADADADADGHAPQTADCLDLLWETAADCNTQTRRWISSGWPRESLLLFAAGWEFMNMNRVVELSAQDATSLGRAYSCACSNVGVFNQETVHGDLRLRSVFFGISQTVSAPSISTSSVTVDGLLCLTTQYCKPIWSDAQAADFADSVCELMRLAACLAPTPATHADTK